ncbi:hypothetical protein DBZ36_14630 [Alginatibacterium sediminis]|uniref:HdeD family acid-resistance protein n=1 Tax=Alginatibacterium sediminis TaxID=2164068 RepID=A0A420E8A9_9ALTE|nr:DUF308 domain-containing protein [Alginatibacterium sediminis]RKF15620.1 hypothetical protein DBZ36_14630 [Alginatibacterium sediminis]
MSQELSAIDSTFLREVKKNTGLTIAVSILVILMGIFAMGSPLVAGVSLAIAVGFILIFSGIAQLFFSVKVRAGIVSIILSILTIIAGGYMVSNPGVALASMTIVLAIYLVITGVFEAVMAFQIKPSKGWVWALFNGLISVLLGAMIWSQFPVSGVWSIGTLIGIKLFFTGWTLLMFGLSARTVVNTQL